MEEMSRILAHDPPLPASVRRIVSEEIRALAASRRALKASEERYRALVEATSDWLWEVDAGGVYTYASPKVKDLLGYEPKEIIGKTPFMFMPPDEAIRVKGIFSEIARRRRPFSGLQNRNLRKDGRLVLIETSGVPILGEDGELLGYRGVDRDITPRLQMEEELKRIRELYCIITENMTDTVWLMDLNLRTTWMSPSVEKKRGYTLQEVQALPLERQVTPESLQLVMETAGRELSPERLLQKDLAVTGNVEVEFYRKDGSTYWSDVRFTVVRDDKGNPRGILCVGRDIDARRKAEKALRQSEERFSQAFRISPAPTLISSLSEGRCSDVNDSFLRMLGYERQEVVGRTARELGIWANEESYRLCLAKLSNEGFISSELLHLRARNGSIREVLASAEIITLDGQQFILWICYDITEQRRLEAQLRRSQKMEAVGTLAGGIAHDFNNILSAVLGYTEVALREKGLSDRLRRYLERIQQAGERARGLVHQILAFSRQAEEKPCPMHAAPIVKEVLKLLRASLPATIRIKHDIRSNDDMILADPTQIHQIMMNLCTNAGQAMAGRQGELRVLLKAVCIGPEEAAGLGEDIPPGRYLNLTVADTGAGMTPEVMERIFESFFTTKKPGEGTGMGLAVVHGIVKGCRGAITVKSEPGIGSEFNVYLPLLNELQEGESGGEKACAVPGGAERILFVDDEELLVEVGAEMLGRLGYNVVARTSSSEALDLFRRQPDRFDLVITDMTMPGMTGVELFRELRRVRSDIPVILCSGFSESITREKALELGLSDFIMKPMVFQQIAPAIRCALGRQPSAELAV